MKPRLLFTAPLDFDLSLCLNYENDFDVRYKSDVLPHSFESNMSEIWVCNPKAKFVIDDAVLDSFSHLRILATPSTGMNHIDLEACKRRGIKVLSLLDDRDGLNEISASAEYTFKLILDALRLKPARELQGKKVGIVGMGRIGQRVERYCEAFGAYVEWSHDPYAGCFTSLETLFSDSDVVVVCCALTPETTGMITKDLILSMPHGAALVNTARGEIIDENGLYDAMILRPDLRVALDVLQGETTGTADWLRFIERGAIVSKHVAGETFDSRTKAARIILRLLQRELEGSGRERDTRETATA